jgi:hypothetical protein
MPCRISTLIAVPLAIAMLVAPVVAKTASARNPNIRIPKVRRVGELMLDAEMSRSTISNDVSIADLDGSTMVAIVVKTVRLAHEVGSKAHIALRAACTASIAHGAAIFAALSGRHFLAGNSPLRC